MGVMNVSMKDGFVDVYIDYVPINKVIIKYFPYLAYIQVLKLLYYVPHSSSFG